jgi:hypothetical protein
MGLDARALDEPAPPFTPRAELVARDEEPHGALDDPETQRGLTRRDEIVG